MDGNNGRGGGNNGRGGGNNGRGGGNHGGADNRDVPGDRNDDDDADNDNGHGGAGANMAQGQGNNSKQYVNKDGRIEEERMNMANYTERGIANDDIAHDRLFAPAKILRPTGRSSDSLEAIAPLSPKQGLIFETNNVALRKTSVSSAGLNTFSIGSSNTMSVIKKIKALKFNVDNEAVDQIYIEDGLSKNKMALNNKTVLEIIAQGNLN